MRKSQPMKGDRAPVACGCRSTDADPRSILYVDPLCGERGHLVDDDLFLAECIAPLADRFLAATSSVSAANLSRALGVATWETPALDRKSRFPRLRLFRIALSLPSAGFQDVVFQSFEEISTLLYMLRHPSKRVHLVVTNNLRPDRLDRHPVLGRIFLRAVFRRAASVIVHSQYEVDRVCSLFPTVDPAKIRIKPFHKFSGRQARTPWADKSNSILFLGPELTHKRVTPLLQMIEADKKRRFRYVFCSMNDRTTATTRAFLESRDNVELRFGYLSSEEYARLFAEATFVVLTHDKDFKGTISGAFCDAVASGTAIVARDMPPHDEFFTRFGPMGYLVNYEEAGWYEHILAANLAEEYAVFDRSMNACREACDMEAIREVFRTVLNYP